MLQKNDAELDIQSYPENIRPYISMLYPKSEHENREFDDLILEQFKLTNTNRNTARKTSKETSFIDFFNNARNMRLQFNEILNPKLKIKKRRIREKANIGTALVITLFSWLKNGSTFQIGMTWVGFHTKHAVHNAWRISKCNTCWLNQNTRTALRYSDHSYLDSNEV